MKDLKADFNKYRANMKDNPVTDMIGYGTHNQPAEQSLIMGKERIGLLPKKDWITTLVEKMLERKKEFHV